jgi:cellulose synthase (UDP-forming)
MIHAAATADAFGPEMPEPTTVALLTRAQRAEYLVAAAVWVAALAYFWAWWLQPAHVVGIFGYVTVSLTLVWITFLPGYFLTIFLRARKPVGPLRLPRGSRVAMVVTKAPSEPFCIVAETLTAMLAQRVPHDTWLADEDPDAATVEWCRRNGVFLSTRKGNAAYHRATWPRRTRCKEGNLAYFYDHYGYEGYDFVVQLDADHVPQKNYLLNMLLPFSDPAVGYVSAPSICDRNVAESWSARGRLYAEASMHGSLQAGYNGGLAPLCIGSHYAVRTAALKQIGGLGPELAEDHSTTLMMNSFGWRGVHALDAIASGDGPRTFTDLVTQEFQWSRSLVMLLLQYSPKYVPSLPGRLKFQFLFSQLWYPLFSFFMALMFVMPVIALVRGESFANVTYVDFLVHFGPLSAILIVMAYRWRASGSFRPFDAKILSWEATLFLFARWPWALAGTAAAIRDWLTGSFVDFRITPKGSSQVDPLPARVLAPYGLLSLGSIMPVLLIGDAGKAGGFYIFAIVNALLYAILMLVIVVQHARENTVRAARRSYRSALAASLLGLIVLPGVATAERGMNGIESLGWGAGRLSLIEYRYSVAGAGLARDELRKARFNPRWIPESL